MLNCGKNTVSLGVSATVKNFDKKDAIKEARKKAKDDFNKLKNAKSDNCPEKCPLYYRTCTDAKFSKPSIKLMKQKVLLPFKIGKKFVVVPFMFPAYEVTVRATAICTVTCDKRGRR